MECDNGSLDRTFECVPISVYAEILQSFNEKLSQRMTTLLVIVPWSLVVAGTSGKPSKKSWVKVATLLAVKS